VPDARATSRGHDTRLRQRDLTAVQVAQLVRRGLAEMTGLEAEGVTSLEARDDGTWRATVELLELSRIPETDDVLGSYEALVGASGELLGYQRVRRYARARSLQQQGGL
jgi:Gas vesicle synthesis protein GvpO